MLNQQAIHKEGLFDVIYWSRFWEVCLCTDAPRGYLSLNKLFRICVKYFCWLLCLSTDRCTVIHKCFVVQYGIAYKDIIAEPHIKKYMYFTLSKINLKLWFVISPSQWKWEADLFQWHKYYKYDMYFVPKRHGCRRLKIYTPNWLSVIVVNLPTHMHDCPWPLVDQCKLYTTWHPNKNHETYTMNILAKLSCSFIFM